MKARLFCPYCARTNDTEFTAHFIPKNDNRYQFTCPAGHHFEATIVYHEFQKLFEIAIEMLSSDYYREAIASFAASYERFMELFIRIVMRANKIENEVTDKAWKNISHFSERQFGAFIVLFALEFSTQPNLLSNTLIRLRNQVIHQGYFPTKEECISYGSAVLDFIRATIKRLHASEKHHDELIRSINDQDDFSATAPELHFYAYPLIGTNRPPENDTNTLEDMLSAAIQARTIHMA